MIEIDHNVQQLRLVVADLLTVTHQILDSSVQRPNLHQTIPVQLQHLMMGTWRGNIDQHNQLLPSTPGVNSSTASLTLPMSVAGMSATTSSSYLTDADDNASIRTTSTARSIFSMGSVRSISHRYIEALNSSRVYKLVHRRRYNFGSRDATLRFSVSTGGRTSQI